MTIVKHNFLLIALSFLIYSCSSQSNNNSQISKINFEKLIFHSSACNGMCPQIDIEIDSNRNIKLNREIYKAKGEIDKYSSGNFKGILNQVKFNELLQELRASDYNNLIFPDITCCDGVVITIIIYSNGIRKYLKSMTPPPKAERLISFLHKIADNAEQMTRINEEIKFEE